jgi:hypothetical protein
MRELEVGIRFNKTSGIHFFGTEEANQALQSGARIVALEPGGAIMEKLGEEGGKVQLTLTGFSLKVKIDDP